MPLNPGIQVVDSRLTPPSTAEFKTVPPFIINGPPLTVRELERKERNKHDKVEREHVKLVRERAESEKAPVKTALHQDRSNSGGFMTSEPSHGTIPPGRSDDNMPTLHRHTSASAASRTSDRGEVHGREGEEERSTSEQLERTSGIGAAASTAATPDLADSDAGWTTRSHALGYVS